MPELSVDLDVVARFAPTVAEQAGALRNLAAWLPANDSDLGVVFYKAAESFENVATSVNTFVQDMLDVGQIAVIGWRGTADGAERAIFSAAERAANAAAYDALTIADFQMAAGTTGPSLSQLRVASPELDDAIDMILIGVPENEKALALSYVTAYYSYYIDGGRERGEANPQIGDPDAYGFLAGISPADFDDQLNELFGVRTAMFGLSANYGEDNHLYDNQYGINWADVYYKAGGYNGQAAIAEFGGVDNIPDDHPFWSSFTWRQLANDKYLEEVATANPNSKVLQTMQGLTYVIRQERLAYQTKLSNYFETVEGIPVQDERDAYVRANPTPIPPPPTLTPYEMFDVERAHSYNFDPSTNTQFDPQLLDRTKFASPRNYADFTNTVCNPYVRAALGLDPIKWDGPGAWFAPIKFLTAGAYGIAAGMVGVYEHTALGLTDQEAWANTWRASWDQVSHPARTAEQMADAFKEDPVAFAGMLAGGMVYGAGLASLTRPLKMAAYSSVLSASPALQGVVTATNAAMNARLGQLVHWAHTLKLPEYADANGNIIRDRGSINFNRTHTELNPDGSSVVSRLVSLAPDQWDHSDLQLARDYTYSRYREAESAGFVTADGRPHPALLEAIDTVEAVGNMLDSSIRKRLHDAGVRFVAGEHYEGYDVQSYARRFNLRLEELNAEARATLDYEIQDPYDYNVEVNSANRAFGATARRATRETLDQWVALTNRQEITDAAVRMIREDDPETFESLLDLSVESLSVFPSTWTDRIVQAAIVRQHGFTGFEPDTNEVLIGTWDRARITDDVRSFLGTDGIMTPGGYSNTTHEFWHAAQHVNPELLPLEWGFLKRNSTTGKGSFTTNDEGDVEVALAIDTPDVPDGLYATRRYDDGGPTTFSELGPVYYQSLTQWNFHQIGMSNLSIWSPEFDKGRAFILGLVATIGHPIRDAGHIDIAALVRSSTGTPGRSQIFAGVKALLDSPTALTASQRAALEIALGDGDLPTVYRLVVQSQPEVFLDAARQRTWALIDESPPVGLNGTPGSESLRIATALVESYRPLSNDVLSVLTQRTNQLDLQLAGVEHRLKTPTSLARKISGGLVSPDEVNDIVRFTVISPAEGFYANAAEVTRGLQNEGYTLTALRDTWGKNGPYTGVNMNFSSPTGQMFEVQIHTQQSFDLKMAAHDMYADSRLDATPTKIKEELKVIRSEIGSALELPSDDAQLLRSLLTTQVQGGPS